MYYIRTEDRISPVVGCPERSWLSYDDSDCNENGDDAPIHMVDLPEAKLWELKKSYDPE